MDSPCIKQTVCKVLKIFQHGKYLVAYVLNLTNGNHTVFGLCGEGWIVGGGGGLPLSLKPQCYSLYCFCSSNTLPELRYKELLMVF